MVTARGSHTGESAQCRFPDFPEPSPWIAAEQVNGGCEPRVRRYLQASRSQFADLPVSYLVAGLPPCATAGGIEPLFPRIRATPRLGLVCSPIFFQSSQ